MQFFRTNGKNTMQGLLYYVLFLKLID